MAASPSVILHEVLDENKIASRAKLTSVSVGIVGCITATFVVMCWLANIEMAPVIVIATCFLAFASIWMWLVTAAHLANVRAQLPRQVAITRDHLQIQYRCSNELYTLSECSWYIGHRGADEFGYVLNNGPAVLICTPSGRIACGDSVESQKKWIDAMFLLGVPEVSQAGNLWWCAYAICGGVLGGGVGWFLAEICERTFGWRGPIAIVATMAALCGAISGAVLHSARTGKLRNNSRLFAVLLAILFALFPIRFLVVAGAPLPLIGVFMVVLAVFGYLTGLKTRSQS